jgi:hypothetical protein
MANYAITQDADTDLEIIAAIPLRPGGWSKRSGILIHSINVFKTLATEEYKDGPFQAFSLTSL